LPHEDFGFKGQFGLPNQGSTWPSTAIRSFLYIKDIENLPDGSRAQEIESCSAVRELQVEIIP
jgi:hypothetical protein